MRNNIYTAVSLVEFTVGTNWIGFNDKHILYALFLTWNREHTAIIEKKRLQRVTQ